MSEQQPKYKFYPSILDKYEKYLHVDRDFEGFFNKDRETGEYKRSYEELEAEALQSLIDAINRVPFDSEKADKGTVFNELVDSFLHHRRSERVKMRGDTKNDMLFAAFNGRSFVFSYQFVQEAAEYFKGSLSQVQVSAPIDTCYGMVELYGYIDELRGDKVYDIKTTSSYEFGKYAEGWQRHLYPYCLVESGMCTGIYSFEYTAYQLKGGTDRSPVIYGTQYPEVYKYEHGKSREKLRCHCERFIEFLESHRDKITDEKIFGKL